MRIEVAFEEAAGVLPVMDASVERARVMARILEVNGGTTREFLDGFGDAALRTYLEHLEAANVPRGRMARWVRPGDTPAIMVREAAE